MEILNDNCKNVGFQLHCCNLQAKQKIPDLSNLEKVYVFGSSVFVDAFLQVCVASLADSNLGNFLNVCMYIFSTEKPDRTRTVVFIPV
jgi:hypothetical protein